MAEGSIWKKGSSALSLSLGRQNQGSCFGETLWCGGISTSQAAFHLKPQLIRCGRGCCKLLAPWLLTECVCQAAQGGESHTVFFDGELIWHRGRACTETASIHLPWHFHVAWAKSMYQAILRENGQRHLCSLLCASCCLSAAGSALAPWFLGTRNQENVGSYFSRSGLSEASVGVRNFKVIINCETCLPVWFQQNEHKTRGFGQSHGMWFSLSWKTSNHSLYCTLWIMTVLLFFFFPISIHRCQYMTNDFQKFTSFATKREKGEGHTTLACRQPHTVQQHSSVPIKSRVSRKKVRTFGGYGHRLKLEFICYTILS